MPDPLVPTPAADESAGTFSQGAGDTGHDSTAPVAAEGIDLSGVLAPPEADGEIGRFAHYRVVRMLGHGGMGLVLQAEDTELMRLVALKLMLPQYAKNAGARARFLREARAAARVRHDHVVNIHRVGEHGGVPFLEMELLRGSSLEGHLAAGGPVPADQALRVAREIADGLRAAHALGVVHRDIKPANVWIEPAGRVKILDFGLARDAESDAHLTRSGAVLGTPSYMAPEQALGEPTDARGDLFSLGVLLYRLTTGRLPFAGKTMAAVVAALATATPVPPRQINPDIPEPLARLIERLLAKAPGDRPQTADGVIAELDALGAAPRPAGPAIGSGAVPAAAATRSATGSATPWRRPPAKARGMLRVVATVAVLATVGTLLAFGGWMVSRKPAEVAHATPAPPEAATTPATVPAVPAAEPPPNAEPAKRPAPKPEPEPERPAVPPPPQPPTPAEVAELAKDARDHQDACDRNMEAFFLTRRAPARAETWRGRADAGDPAGGFLFACCLAAGKGAGKDPEAAFLLFRKLAEAGNLEAVRRVGLAYTFGDGVAKDEKKGAEWFDRGARAGHPGCQCSLGLSHAGGRGVPADVAEAEKWYREAAGRKYPLAEWLLGVLFESGRAGAARNYPEAARWYRRAAEGGMPDAQHDLGRLYADPKGAKGVGRDEAEAARWYRKAAENGHALAQLRLADACDKGKGTKKDVTEAIKWYTKAAENDDAPEEIRESAKKAAEDALKRLDDEIK